MKKLLMIIACHLLLVALSARADDFVDVESYDAESSVFQRIADLEQEKVLMQLEKEKAQLQLDLDRMAAEQARLAREQENADLRAEEQAAEIEKQKVAIEQERQKLDEQKKKMAEEAARRATESEREDAADNAKPKKGLAAGMSALAAEKEDGNLESLADRYFLVEIVGAGNQLVATVEHLGNGKQRKVSVGKSLDGYAVRSISIDDGVEFEKDGEIITIGIGSVGKGSAE